MSLFLPLYKQAHKTSRGVRVVANPNAMLAENPRCAQHDASIVLRPHSSYRSNNTSCAVVEPAFHSSHLERMLHDAAPI